MTSLIPIDSVKHADLKLRPDTAVNFAAGQHILPLRAEEIAKAVTCFPVFLTRGTGTGAWSFSMVTSFEVEQNLFVENAEWTATYMPQIIDSYPFYLMQTDETDQYALAMDESSDAFSTTDGDALFDSEGKTSPWLDGLTKRMHGQLQSNQQTALFAEAIEKAGLIKEIGVHVVFSDDTIQTINGLHTIDEDKLQSLNAETLQDFSKRGYLTPLHAMLLSAYQLNTLIRKYNRLVEQQGDSKTIRQIKLEVARDAGATGHVS